jgi:hypothetical protein
MALAISLVTFGCLVGFLLGFVSLGSVALRTVPARIFSNTEYFLISAAVGVTITETLFFVIQPTNRFRLFALIIVGVLAATSILERKVLRECVVEALRSVRPVTGIEKVLLAGITVVAFVEFLASMAPLTGSDALNYHFTVQKQILQHGFQPIFSNSHSLLCGQQHLLILLGLSLGSERLALAFIYLGGILSAAAMAYLISSWTSRRTAGLFTLLFLLTPIVFWQISISGAPDIYMAFFVCVAVILLVKSADSASWQLLALAGLVTGGIAGSKYTGCLIAASLLAVVVIKFRSSRLVLAFLSASVISGCWPYLRNLVWTGNPVFPFFSASLSPDLVSAYTLRNLANDTGAASAHHLSQFLPFTFFAELQKQSLGFWDFFGPVVVALSPVAFKVCYKKQGWGIALSVWFLSATGLFLSSGLPRFLLPVYPLALTFAAAGALPVSGEKWRIVNRVACGVVVLMIAIGAIGLVMYSHNALFAALGFQSKEEYLEQASQDYRVVETVNRMLGDRSLQKTALVFIRHTYYLEVPYLNGNPGTSFEVDPDHLTTPSQWKDFLDKKGIGYVVRSPDYPPAIAGPLSEMEKSGDLTPFKEARVEELQGKRINQDRTQIEVVILKFVH